MSKTIDEYEVKKFSAIANEWWDLNGKFKPLHEINSLRFEYIQKMLDKHFAIPLEKLTFLDVGCGGGILSESCAKTGANVTALDPSKENIEIAKYHAKQESLDINYITGDPEKISNKKFDVVLSMEVIEHVSNPHLFLDEIVNCVKPGGLLFISTINKTLNSLIGAKFAAEYILNLVPKGTHSWKQFLKPSDIYNIVKYNCKIEDVIGINFNILNRSYYLSDNISQNYIMTFLKL